VGIDSIAIPGTGVTIAIDQKGLRVSQESLYLLQFIDQMKLKNESACVPGCGSGLLVMGLAALNPKMKVTGIELQDRLAEKAVLNAKLNGYENRITIRTGDIRHAENRSPDQSHDLIVMNPPFRKMKTGKTSPDCTRRYSNHEHHGTLEDFIRIGSIMLAHKGILACVMLPERLDELLHIMNTRNVPAFQMQSIHHAPSSPANAVLIAGRKGCHSPLIIQPPCFANPGIAQMN
jgi:tRNA1Val (adenine37-N6)-methyltransferase